MHMQLADWVVLCFYFAGVLGLGAWLAFRQRSTDDYFLGGKRMPAWLIGTSLAANQVSAISLVSAPAFVALRPEGGLRWLQYEFAVPLAMAGIILFLGPLYPRLSSASLYEFAELRFGRAVRKALSLIFLVSRGLATGLMLYATALVLSVGMEFPLLGVYLILGLFAVAYTTLGGIQADVYSDVIQFLVLWVGILAAMAITFTTITDLREALGQLEIGRRVTVDPRHHGLGDGNTFSFWPMLTGGLFLYMSYYGCDQSQAQRLMATGDARVVRKSLVINGLLRFPVVLTYCLFGLLLAVLLNQDATFLSRISSLDRPDYLVPVFIITYLPVGFRGLVMSGIFAAAMSSIDSALNSLSAVTMEDFLATSAWAGRAAPAGRRLLTSRAITLSWGLFCLISGLVLVRSPRTIIELVNMVGSAFYGPVLAVFCCGILMKRVGGGQMLLGLVGGTALNLLLWKAAPHVSWLWWNPAGFLGAVALAWGASLVSKGNRSALQWPFAAREERWIQPLASSRQPDFKEWFRDSRPALLTLTLYFFLILGATMALGWFLVAL
jgi:SSS family transporter